MNVKRLLNKLLKKLVYYNKKNKVNKLKTNKKLKSLKIISLMTNKN